jgi:predicted metal-binding protein
MFNVLKIKPKDIIFTIKARDMCRSCKRYGKKACCPPFVESIEYYKNTILQYNYAEIFYKEYMLENYKGEVDAGKKSSLELQKVLLNRRTELIQNGSIFVTAYGGGSCKTCKECSAICRNPEKSLVPLEAAGIEVFATMQKKGIILPHVLTTSFFRIGGVFYD